jgi:hypothetical protein
MQLWEISHNLSRVELESKNSDKVLKSLLFESGSYLVEEEVGRMKEKALQLEKWYRLID